MKRIFPILAFLMAVPAFAQNTTNVSGQVTDGTQSYNYGTWEAHLVGPTGYTGGFYVGGTLLGPSDIRHTGVLDSSGNISTTAFYSNNKITINGGISGVTLWQFTVCSGATSGCYTVSLNVTGASYSVTGNIVSPPIKVAASINNQPAAYADSEIVGGVLGFSYFNLTDQTLHICGPPACTWINVGGSSFTGFNVITSGTNTAAAMLVGSGASLGVTGTGTITATGASGTPSLCPSGQASRGIDSTFAGTGCFTPGGTPGGSNNDIQVKLSSTAFGSGVTNAANVGVSGNIAVKPNSGSNVQYVASWGNDSNDGLSWGTAKLTAYAAIEALPGGSTSPATAGVGAVEIAGTVSYGGPVSNQGLWLIGPEDPNYASPPSGFIIQPANALTIECAIPNAYITQSHLPACLEGWGSGTDATKPPYWYAGTNITNNLLYFQFQYPKTGGKIGIASTGARNGSGAQSINLIVGQNLNQVLGCGPGLDIGDNAFWAWITGGFQGCSAEKFAFSSLSRTSGTVTGVTSATNDFSVGDKITVVAASDASFNSVNGGTYTITGVSGSPQTTITWAQTGPNSSATGAYVVGSKAAAINLDSGTGAMGGIAQIQLRDINTQLDGAIRLTPSPNFTSLWVQNLTMEGSGSTDASAIIIAGNLGTGIFEGDNIQVADTTGGSACALENDGTSSLSFSVRLTSSDCVIGPAQISGIYQASIQSQVISPSRYGESGVIGNRIVAFSDATARMFSPRAVRFTNKATTNMASVTNSGNTTFTTGITVPDGTTGGAQFVSTSSTQFAYLYPQTSQSLSVGDYVVGCAMVRSQTANGYSGSAVSPLSLVNIGDASSVTAFPAVNVGDSQWDWVCQLAKVTQANSNPYFIAMYATYDTTHTLQAYAPVFNYIPTGTISENEIYAYVMSLTPYDKACSVGTICGLSNETLVAGSLQAGSIIDTALTPGTSPICPNGSGGAFTTSGCTGAGGFYQTYQVNGSAQTQEPTANYVAGSNMTITPTTIGGVTTLTFTASTTAATAWSAITSATNANTGTFIATGNAWDFSAATSFKFPTAGAVYPGSGSGNVTVIAQSAAGTPTVTWGTSSGTPVVTASAPLSITAATGNETISNATTGAVGVVQLAGDFAGTGTSPTVVSTHITGGTTNDIVKFSSGNLVNSSIVDNGTLITIGEQLDLTSKPLTTEIANEGATGTTVNKFASLTGAPTTAIITTAGANGAAGIVASGAGTTSNAQIVVLGQVNCVFDGGTTAGHFVTQSASVNGDCTDGGTTAPSSMPVIKVLSTNGGAGTYAVVILGGGGGSGSGSGTVNNCATSGAVAYYATNGTAVSCLSSVTESAGVINLGTAGSVGGQLNISGSTSGTVTIQPQNAAGTYNFNLPITAGTSTYVLTSAAGGSNPMTWTSPTITVNSQSCTLAGSCTIPFITNGNGGNTSQAGLELDNSVSNTSGGSIALTNTGTNKVKFELTGTINPTGGGTGLSNPAAHSLLVSEGSSNFTLITSPTTNGYYLCGFNVVASAAVDPTCNAVGVPVNAQTGTTYTIAATDRASLVTTNNASPIAVTLPQAGSTGFAANFPYVTKNLGAGADTITPTTSTINGGSTLVIPQNWTAFVWSDNTNYFASRFPDYSGFANTGSNSAETFNSTTGAFSHLDNIVNCSPTRAGDIAYWNGSAYACLAGNNSGTQALEENASGVPSWVTITGTGTVTSVGLTVNGTSPSGIFTVTGSPVTSSGTLNFNLAGTSGGVPYFSSSTVMSSSAALTQYGVVVGGGAGAAPASISADTTTTHALFATATAPAFRAIVAGDLPNIPLNQVISPTGSVATFANGNNPLIFNWAQTTASQVGVTFGETTAATSTGTPYNVEIKTLIGSTASPLKVDNSLNGSQTLCAVCILPTWNTTGVVDAALLINPTNTASGTGSLLIDAQTGGTSEFSIDKSGNAKINVSLSIAGGTALATTNQTGTGSLVLATSPTFTSAITAGTDNSTAGTLQLANGSANAHTIWGSAATTSNTIKGPATVVSNNDVMYCAVSSTTCTLTDTGFAYNAVPAADIAAGALANGMTATTQSAGSNDTKVATDAYVDTNACVPGSFASQTDGATVTWAIASKVCANASLTFTTHGGSRTLNLTGLVNGGSYVIWLKQDGTGGENLTGGTGCTWKQKGGGGSTFTLTATASAIDILAFTYDGTNCYANLGLAYN